MKTVYRGGKTYVITCRDGLHHWVRLKQPGRGRIFGQKPCDCAEFKRLGIRLPMRSALKIALGYHAPGRQVVLAKVVIDGTVLEPMGVVHGNLRAAEPRE